MSKLSTGMDAVAKNAIEHHTRHDRAMVARPGSK
jgi:hypothetical protein